MLEEPLAPDALWEGMVWSVFQEFACLRAERGELTIVAFGYD